jgi:hypothetical protein
MYKKIGEMFMWKTQSECKFEYVFFGILWGGWVSGFLHGFSSGKIMLVFGDISFEL